MPGNFNIDRIKTQIQSRGGLTRGIFFQCDIASLTNISGNGEFVFKEDDTLVCKAVTLPPDALDVTEVKYFTRSIKVPATRQFAPITLTFYNTVNHELRSKFISWMNLFNTSKSNVRGAMETKDDFTPISASTSYENFFTTLTLTSYDNTGKMSIKDLLKVGANAGIAAGQSLASDANSIVGSAAGAIGNRFKQQIESNNPALARYTFYNTYPISVSGLQFSQDDDGSYQTYDVEFHYLYSQFANLTSPS